MRNGSFCQERLQPQLTRHIQYRHTLFLTATTLTIVFASIYLRCAIVQRQQEMSQSVCVENCRHKLSEQWYLNVGAIVHSIYEIRSSHVDCQLLVY